MEVYGQWYSVEDYFKLVHRTVEIPQFFCVPCCMSYYVIIVLWVLFIVLYTHVYVLKPMGYGSCSVWVNGSWVTSGCLCI